MLIICFNEIAGKKEERMEDTEKNGRDRWEKERDK